jgi:hypothetical protein
MERWIVTGFAVIGLGTNVVHGQSIMARSLSASVSLQDRPNDANAERTKWNLLHRFQGGWEYDSNIYESGSQQASGSARFLLNTAGDYRSMRLQMHYNYAAALQTYPGFGDENKLSHDLSGQIGVRIKPWLHISSKANAALKFYLEENLANYGATSGHLTASFFLPHSFAVDLSGETGQLDYALTDAYDFTFNGVELALRRRLSASSAIELTCNRRELRYQRRAFEYSSVEGLFPKTIAQRDALTTGRAAMTYGRKIVAQIALEAQSNRSNSFGYDYNRFRVSALLGFRPAPRWMLRAAGLLQNKRYRDDLLRLNLRDLDTEREQSNFLVVDLSRDFSAAVSLVTRAAFYDNESTVPGVFYRKTLFFAGVEIRL